MRFQDIARFEFRVFAADLAQVRAVLAARAPGVLQPRSRETYFVSQHNAESNVKIRSQRLEVKGLQGRLRALEQWTPILNAPLPVSADEIENTVAPALGLNVDLTKAPPFGEVDLLAWAQTQPALATVVVDKHRTLFDLGACEAEFTELQIGFERLHTVAVEAPEAAAAEALVRDAGLSGIENVSYTLYLQRHLF